MCNGSSAGDVGLKSLHKEHYYFLFVFFLTFLKFYFILKLYNIVLVLPNITGERNQRGH